MDDEKPKTGWFGEDLGFLDMWRWALSGKGFWILARPFTNQSTFAFVSSVLGGVLLYFGVYYLIALTLVSPEVLGRGVAHAVPTYTATAITTVYYTGLTVRAKGGPFLNLTLAATLAIFGSIVAQSLLADELARFPDRFGLPVIAIMLLTYTLPLKTVHYYYRKYEPETLEAWAEKHIPYRDFEEKVVEGSLP